ncbi:unnamed protein product [Caretta caretta]
MAEEVRKVPLKPIRAWEETRPPRRKSPRKSPQQQQELCVPQPFHADSPSPGNASCFMGPDSQEKETLEYINAFLKGNEQEEAKKLEFLDCVITISRAALTRHPERNLAAFLGKALLVKKIKTLNTMDELLKALVCEDEKPNLVVLQNIVEVLLPWTASKEVHVRLRAVGRITWLTKFISGQHKFKGVEEFRVLGQLVGCLTLCSAEQEQEICRSAMEGLHHLYAFMLRQKCTMLANQSAEYLQVLREWRAENTFWVTWFTNTSNIAMMFGKYFNPSERMDFLLTAIEGMRDTSVHDSVAARHMLHVILWVPSPSLERVSEAVLSVYHNLDSISEPLAQQQLLKALVVLGDQYSEEVVTTLLGCSLSCDRVCWDTLRSAVEFLRWSQLGALLQKKELWRGCDCLVACYKRRAETFLCQTMAFLENPQAPIREAAIRFLGLTARQLDQKSLEKLDAIFNVLKGLQQDSKSSVRCLASQTMLILNACKKHRPARASLRTLLHRMRLMCTRESPVIEAAQLP